MTPKRATLGAALLLLVPLELGAGWFGGLFAGARPVDVGTGAPAPCPPTPNCVSSFASTDPAHAIEPIAFAGNADAALDRVTKLAQAMPGARLVSTRRGYAHLEFASTVMGFVDDVELRAGVRAIEVRSASRIGRSDFGVNRRRIEALRAASR
jgi:uncharacterized protein (DUF1499 family)